LPFAFFFHSKKHHFTAAKSKWQYYCLVDSGIENFALRTPWQYFLNRITIRISKMYSVPNFIMNLISLSDLVTAFWDHQCLRGMLTWRQRYKALHPWTQHFSTSVPCVRVVTR
jgi:hypothetical protein